MHTFPVRILQINSIVAMKILELERHFSFIGAYVAHNTIFFGGLVFC